MIKKVEHLLSKKKIFVVKKKYLNQIINKFDNKKISADHIQMYKKIINEE